MAAFPSVKAISESSPETLLEKVPSLGEKTARAIVEHFTRPGENT